MRTRTFFQIILFAFAFIFHVGLKAQTVNELISNYSGTVTWDEPSKTITFESSGTVYFASKVGDGTNLEKDQMQNFWDVPIAVERILIKENVSVTCAFHTFSNCSIEGEDRYTSIVYGTPISRWADANNPGSLDLTEWHYGQFQHYGGVLHIKNLTSLNPFSFHVRGWGHVIHVENCDFIDDREGAHNHSDGFTGGDGSTVNNCYFSTGDDIFKTYFSYTVTNCTVDMRDNTVPIQLGWNDYGDGAVVDFYNLTITGDDGRWSPENTNGVIVGRTGTYSVTVNIYGLELQNPNATMVMLWEEGMTLNGSITDANIAVKQYTQEAYNLGTDNLTICGSTEHSSVYNCVLPGVDIPGLIQAEDYTGMDGISTESSSDVDGGENITSIEAGDWFEYDVVAREEGEYTLSYRVASETENIHFELNSNSKVLAMMNSSSTGSGQSWKTISSVVNLPLGASTIRISAQSDGWKMNWLDLKKKPVLNNVGNLEAIVKSHKSIELSWTENIPDETGFIIERKIPTDDLYTKIDTAGANSTNYIDSAGLDEFTLYSYRIRTMYADGTSQPTSSIYSRSSKVTHASLPSPWNSTSFGDTLVAMASTSTFENDTFTIDAGDGDFWTTIDRGHFIYQPFTGDCEIIAEITDFTFAQKFSMAGVMIRESLDLGSKFSAMLMMSEPGPILRDRAATDGTVYQEFGDEGLEIPYWVRLKRAGNEFTGYISPDNVQWRKIRSMTFDMVQDIYIGLAATSHTTDTTGTYAFSNVSVDVAKIDYTLTSYSTTGGLINYTGSFIMLEGGNYTYTFTPDAGYEIEDVLVDGNSVGAVNTYTLENITSDHTISVSFKKISYTISATAGANGAISPSGDITVNHGESQSFNFTPDAGFIVDKVIVDDINNGTIKSFTFSNIIKSSTIHVEFKQGTTSANDTERNLLSIYPNPADDLIYIEGLSEQSGRLSLYNISGQIVYSSQVNKTISELDVSVLKQGLYLLVYSNDDYIITRRITIN